MKERINEIINNESNLILDMARIRPCEFKILKSYSYTKNGKFRPSAIFDIRLTEENLTEVMKDIKEQIKNGHLPNGIRTNPLSEPMDIDERLINLGFTASGTTVGMHLDLTSYQETSRIPDGLEIMDLVNEDTEAFAGVLGRELLKLDEEGIHDFTILSSKMLDSDQFHCLVGKIDGQVVATAILYMKDGVSGVHFVATDRNHRRKGYGKAITLEAVLLAKSKGYQSCVLQASELGKGVYESLGFKAYCLMKRYRLNESYEG